MCEIEQTVYWRGSESSAAKVSRLFGKPLRVNQTLVYRSSSIGDQQEFSEVVKHVENSNFRNLPERFSPFEILKLQ